MMPCAKCKKLCEDGGRAVWPFFFATFLAGFVAFITWLALLQAGVPQHQNLWFSGAAFLSILLLLLGYMMACIRRHCARRRAHTPFHSGSSFSSSRVTQPSEASSDSALCVKGRSNFRS